MAVHIFFDLDWLHNGTIDSVVEVLKGAFRTLGKDPCTFFAACISFLRHPTYPKILAIRWHFFALLPAQDLKARDRSGPLHKKRTDFEKL